MSPATILDVEITDGEVSPDAHDRRNTGRKLEAQGKEARSSPAGVGSSSLARARQSVIRLRGHLVYTWEKPVINIIIYVT